MHHLVRYAVKRMSQESCTISDYKNMYKTVRGLDESSVDRILSS